MLAVLFASGPAAAQTSPDRIAREMRAEGFTRITAQRTLLGRIRIVGESDRARREVVLDPGTGVILRDYTRRLSPGDRARSEGDEEVGGRARDEADRGGGAGPDDDDGGDDDGDDDRGGGDNGGGNDGGGSGGSGGGSSGSDNDDGDDDNDRDDDDRDDDDRDDDDGDDDDEDDD